MKVKRIFALAMTGALSFSLLTGCGSGSSDSGSKADPSTTSKSSTVSDISGETAKDVSGEGGSTADGRKVVMSWWGNQVRNERTTEVLSLFTEQTGIETEGQFYQWDDYWNKMATSAAGNSLPDIIQMDRSYIAQYVSSGEIIDLTPYIESGAINTDNIEDSVMETGAVDGKVYGMVAGLSCPCIVYNKTVTDSLGIEIKDNMTTEEFIAIAREITEKTGYRANLVSGNFWSAWDRGEGHPILEAKAPVDSYEPYISGFKLLEEGIKDGWHLTPDCIDRSAIETDPLIYGSDPSTMAWCTNNGGSNLLTSFQNSAPEGMEIGITTIPTNDPKASNSLGVSQYFCISSDCKDVDAAVSLIDWLINSEDCNNILLAERGVPASSAIAEAISSKMDAPSALGTDYVVNVIEVNCSPMDPPVPDGHSEISNTQVKLVEAVGYGEMTAEEAAKEYYDKMIEVWGE